MSELFKLTVQAGRHDRENCPVAFGLPADSPQLKGAGDRPLRMIAEDGRLIPVQSELKDGQFILHWIVDRLPAGETLALTVASSEGDAAEGQGGVRVVRKEHRFDVEIDGAYFTSYVTDPELAKPYLGPMMGPYGESFTRLDFETTEHPHHRSVWFAIGDVNGIDLWNEPKDRHGKQRVLGSVEAADGPVLARLVSKQQWCSFAGKPQLEETRTMTFYRTPSGGRIVDMDSVMTALGRVEFGATKEAGPLGIRVAESMKAESGGTIVNAYGSIGEAECWGRRAPWCDYYGQVGGHTLGIAAFDHPDNVDYPTYWHVRDYGLLAANNLYFLGGKLLQKGQSIAYRHRMYFHEGDTAVAKVADKYQDYIHPPKVALISP